MRAHLVIRFVLVLFFIGIFAAASHAQTSTQTTTQTSSQTTTNQTCATPCPSPSTNNGTGAGTSAELYVNAGGIWPTRMDTFGNNKIKSQEIYGLKGGIIWGGGAELEASFEYLNHFEPGNSPNLFDINTAGTIGQPSILGFMYDLNGAWNFGNRRVLGAKFSPYLVAGGGALMTEVRHGGSAFLQGGGLALTASGNLIPNPGPTKIIHDGDTFFTVNYGGGFKAMNLWGPIGFRVDLRGRTIPNFYHSTPNWAEVTGGLLVSWGQR